MKSRYIRMQKGDILLHSIISSLESVWREEAYTLVSIPTAYTLMAISTRCPRGTLTRCFVGRLMSGQEFGDLPQKLFYDNQ